MPVFGWSVGGIHRSSFPQHLSEIGSSWKSCDHERCNVTCTANHFSGQFVSWGTFSQLGVVVKVCPPPTTPLGSPLDTVGWACWGHVGRTWPQAPPRGVDRIPHPPTERIRRVRPGAGHGLGRPIPRSESGPSVGLVGFVDWGFWLWVAGAGGYFYLFSSPLPP